MCSGFISSGREELHCSMFVTFDSGVPAYCKLSYCTEHRNVTFWTIIISFVVIYGLHSIFCNFTNLVKDEQQTFTQSEFQLAYLTKLLSTFWKHKNIIICWEICPRQQKAIHHLFTHCICDCFICLNDKKGPTVTIILIYMDG